MSLKDVINRVRSLRGFKVKAGVLEGASPYGNGLSVAQVAMWNEYGVAIPVSNRMRGYLGANGFHLKKSTSQLNIPARPFMRNAAMKYGDDWRIEASGALAAVIRGEESNDGAGNTIGTMMQAGIQESIDSNIQPPNHPFTMAPKSARVVDSGGSPIMGESGTKQTLISTGHLFDSISFEVEK